MNHARDQLPNHLNSSWILLAPLAVWTLMAAVAAAEPEKKTPGSARWESTIRRFEEAAQKLPPPRQGILFIGSSSIRGWKLEASFPGLPVINRGFGGSQVADSVEFAGRILIPHEPRVVVIYAGDNDIAAGKSPEQVAADYRAFVKKVHAALPKTRIVYIAIKPSIARWNLVESLRKANALILSETKQDERLAYVDVDRPMIGADGKPRPELFVKDGLHLSPAGYKLWASLVRPHIAEKK